MINVACTSFIGDNRKVVVSRWEKRHEFRLCSTIRIGTPVLNFRFRYYLGIVYRIEHCENKQK